MRQISAGKAPHEATLDMRLSQLKGPFCNFVGKALLETQDRAKKILPHGFFHLKLAWAQGPEHEAVYAEAKSLNDEGKLFGGKNQKKTLGAGPDELKNPEDSDPHVANNIGINVRRVVDDPNPQPMIPDG